MGKLVLTRRAGESVKLTEPNGDVWLVTSDGKCRLDVQRCNEPPKRFYYGEVIHFAGGNVELRPHRRPDQAIPAFEFPRDVTIVRTEIA